MFLISFSLLAQHINQCLHILDTREIHKESANDACLATAWQPAYHEFFINDDQKCSNSAMIRYKNSVIATRKLLKSFTTKRKHQNYLEIDNSANRAHLLVGNSARGFSLTLQGLSFTPVINAFLSLTLKPRRSLWWKPKVKTLAAGCSKTPQRASRGILQHYDTTISEMPTV